MPIAVSREPKSPAGFSPSENTVSCTALLAVATPSLYLDNPFRRMGLSVLSTAREISRRSDELKLSLELGTLETPWAFASDTELTVNEIREAMQKLKSPRDRLIQEFFWFWPESYPLEGPDEALAALARGETAPALESWLRMAESGSRVARHNLAVYHHLLVLDWERLAEDKDARLNEVWPQTLEYWQTISSDEPLWALIRRRVEKIADPQLPVDFVAEIRASLPAALAKINAALLLYDAENGKAERVSLHASLIAMIHRNAVGVARTLEASAAPVVRRIDNYVATARREANDESVPALPAASNLVRNCDADLRLVETLCGNEETYREVSNGVADAALGCLVAHQRRTKDDQGCLPLLVYLLNMTVTPELRPRIEETYQVIRDNVVSAADTDDATEIVQHEVEHRLIKEAVIPHLDSLQLNPVGRLQFTSRIAAWLGNLATTAWRDLERIDLAHAVLTTALELPCEPVIRGRLEEQWSEIEAELARPQEKSLRLERADHVVSIAADEIRFDDQALSPGEITGLRHGVGSSGDWVVAWCSAEHVVVLDSSNVLQGETAAEDHAAILEALYQFVVPDLSRRLLEAIRGGATVLLGQTTLNRAGAFLTAELDAPEENQPRVPYARLQNHVNDGLLTVTDLENPALTLNYSLSEEWNAVVIGSVLDALSQDTNPVLHEP